MKSQQELWTPTGTSRTSSQFQSYWCSFPSWSVRFHHLLLKHRHASDSAWRRKAVWLCAGTSSLKRRSMRGVCAVQTQVFAFLSQLKKTSLFLLWISECLLFVLELPLSSPCFKLLQVLFIFCFFDSLFVFVGLPCNLSIKGRVVCQQTGDEIED